MLIFVQEASAYLPLTHSTWHADSRTVLYTLCECVSGAYNYLFAEKASDEGSNIHFNTCVYYAVIAYIIYM